MVYVFAFSLMLTFIGIVHIKIWNWKTQNNANKLCPYPHLFKSKTLSIHDISWLAKYKYVF